MVPHQPRAISRRAIEHGNLILAEGMIRELGQITFAEALELTALVAQTDPWRHSRYAVRWLRRLLEEHERVTIEEAVLAAAALLALGGPRTSRRTRRLPGLGRCKIGEARRRSSVDRRRGGVQLHRVAAAD